MARHRITRDTVAAGRVVVVGEVVDLSDDEARVLVALGKAVPADAGAAVAVAAVDAKPAQKRTR